MQTRYLILSALVLLTALRPVPVLAQGSAFTYQGSLTEDENPANGLYDLRFVIFDAESNGVPLGVVSNLSATVSGGLFTVTLDFGAGLFDGGDRWLEVAARTNGGGAFNLLAPRQPITSTPYAIRAAGVDAANITGTLPLTQLPPTVVTNGGSDVNLAGTFSGDAGGLTNLDSTRLDGPLTVLPGNPVNIAQIDDGPAGVRARSIAVAGDYAYLANDEDGLRVYDISDPTTPINIGHTNNGTYNRGVAVSGNYVYLASFWDGLLIYDVSDPASPTNIGSINDGGSAWGVAVSGDYAYLADTADGLQVFDVSNPANPTLVGETNTGGFGRDVVVSGNYAYLAGHSGGLHIYDISDPTTPVEVGATNNTEGIALGVAVSGTTVYLANGTDGLRVYDVSNPADPQNIGHLATGAGQSFSVVVADGYAYMAEDSAGLRVYDVHDPTAPVLVGQFDDVYSIDVAVVGHHAYLANGFKGLYIFDVAVARATSFSGHFFGNGGGLTNLHLNSLQASDGTPAQAVYVDNVGRVGIGTTSPSDDLEVSGNITCVALNETSDRHLKENFEQVNSASMLEKVAALPISLWNFKGDDVRHVGPMAQDFHAAFGVGPDDRHIAVVDAGGVALSAIQGLNRKLEQKEAEIAELQRQLHELSERVSALTNREAEQ